MQIQDYKLNFKRNTTKINIPVKRSFWLITIVPAIAALLYTGCQTTGNEASGKLVVKITDAPFPIDMIENASVTITKVEIRKADTIPDEYPFIVVSEDTMIFNLLDLRNGMTAEIAELDIPAGDYDLVRLYVDGASLTVAGNGTYDVKVPGGSQTGIKVFIKPALTVSGGLTSEVLIDFSLEKSFILKGNMDSPAGIKGFNFKPVIRAVNNTIAGQVRGIVLGNDSAVLAGAAVWLSQDTVISSAITDDAGFYLIPGVPAGPYDIAATAAGLDTLSYAIDVMAGNVTVQNFKLDSPETE